MGKQKGRVFRARQWARKLIQKYMPLSIRHALLRRFILIDPAPPDRLEVRLAKTQEELEAAFHLLHNAYVSSGFMDPDPSGLRVTKYHSLPATTTIIALWDGEIVGTTSLIRRSSYGMPLESIFDVSHLVEDGSRIFETSSLAVHPKFSGQHGKIFFPLIKFIVEYSLEFFGSRYMAIAVNPSWIEFYEAAFGFKRLTAKPVENYSFVKGAPAVGAYIDLMVLEQELKRIYGNKRLVNNFGTYLFEHKIPNIKLPERTFSKISDPVLTPELLDYFFNKKTQVFSTMTDREIFTLHQLYEDVNFRKVLPPQPRPSNVLKLREGARLEVNFTGRIQISGAISIPVVITDVSKKGIGIVADRHLRADEVFTLTVNVDGVDHYLPKAKMRWAASNQRKCGVLIMDAPQSWEHLVNTIQNDILRRSA